QYPHHIGVFPRGCPQNPVTKMSQHLLVMGEGDSQRGLADSWQTIESHHGRGRFRTQARFEGREQLLAADQGIGGSRQRWNHRIMDAWIHATSRVGKILENL